MKKGGSEWRRDSGRAGVRDGGSDRNRSGSEGRSKKCIVNCLKITYNKNNNQGKDDRTNK